MAWLKKLLILIVLLSGLILGVWFSTENTQPISVLLLGFPMPAVSAGVLLCGVLLLGAVIGFVVSLISGIKLRNEKLLLKRRLARCEKELDRLRKASVKP